MKKDEEVEKIKSEGCPMLFCCSSILFLDQVFFLFVFMFGDWWYQRKQGNQFIQPRGIKFNQHIYVISMIKLDGSACSIKGHFNKSLCTLVSWQGKSNDAEYYTPSRDVSSNQVLKNKKQTWKTGTQVFTQDSNEIQHVLQFAKPYVHVITMRAIAEYKKYRKLNEQSNVVISHAHETRSAF